MSATLSRTATAYRNTKLARRLLRARAGAVTGGPGHIQLEDYDRFMEMINDVQLQLEGLKGDVKSSAPAFSSSHVLFAQYEFMEKYLNRLVKEYERSRHKFFSLKSDVTCR
ncbi:MAG: hypothetical protein ABJB61_03640 [bacterium]